TRRGASDPAPRRQVRPVAPRPPRPAAARDAAEPREAQRPGTGAGPPGRPRANRRADRRAAVHQHPHRPLAPGPDPGQDRLPPPRRPDPAGPGRGPCLARPPACGYFYPGPRGGAKRGTTAAAAPTPRQENLLSRPERPARSEQQEPTMFTPMTGRASRLSAGTRPRRITAILAILAGGVLAWATAIPAASAAIIPVPGAGAAYGPVPATLPSVRVITVGGMPGWQITLIAAAAALAAATAAVFLDRSRADRRAASTR